MNALPLIYSFHWHPGNLPRYKGDEGEHQAQNYENHGFHSQKRLLLLPFHDVFRETQTVIVNDDRPIVPICLAIVGVATAWALLIQLFERGKLSSQLSGVTLLALSP